MSDAQPPERATAYQVRRVQMIDAVILTGVLAVFGFVLNTDRNVTALRAEQAVAEKLEARDPVIRESRYKLDQAITRTRLDSAEGRIERLEGSHE
jgi:hypothetical protein